MDVFEYLRVTMLERSTYGDGDNSKILAYADADYAKEPGRHTRFNFVLPHAAIVSTRLHET